MTEESEQSAGEAEQTEGDTTGELVEAWLESASEERKADLVESAIKQCEADLESVVRKLEKKPEALSESDKAELEQYFKKYDFKDKGIEIEAVCTANGGRSPAIQALLIKMVNDYGIERYFNITSSGSKMDKIRTRELPPAFKVNIIRTALHYQTTVRPILSESEVAEANYALEQLRSAGKDEETLNAFVESAPEIKEIVDRIDLKSIRIMHIDEARQRDRVLKEMDLYSILAQHYYQGKAPPETFPEFYSNRRQTIVEPNTPRRIKAYVAAKKSNAADIVKLCEKQGIVDVPAVYILDSEDTIGVSDEKYGEAVLELGKVLQKKLPIIVKEFIAEKESRRQAHHDLLYGS